MALPLRAARLSTILWCWAPAPSSPASRIRIVGHKAGDEFDVNVKFPEEYQAEELAGKDATFKVKLHEVQYKELPELDDDFAKDVSEYDTLDELKDSIRKGIRPTRTSRLTRRSRTT